ncbi:MAG: SLC13 family permease [Defluviitaleaceae bacterium]|nr:SLC13 family permease [Defluviitaleaceae bacterium]MCL2262078.1 SLC13 family permease [Defluviitaleaceae bacterium]
MEISIGVLGVVAGILVAVILIAKKVSPSVALFTGSIVGALVGGLTLHQSFNNVLLPGTQALMGVTSRIIAGAVLAGVLVESGAAETIARTIVKKLGEKRSILALAVACMAMVAVGVFNTVSIIMLSPIALSVAKKANFSKAAALLALSGGSKAGNIMSPNPNTVAATDTLNSATARLLAETYYGFEPGTTEFTAKVSELLGTAGFAVERGVTLSAVMMAGIPGAIVTVIATAIIAGMWRKKGSYVTDADDIKDDAGEGLPSFLRAASGPFIAIALLMVGTIGHMLDIEVLRNFQIDAFFALPIAALCGAIIMGKGKQFIAFANAGVTGMMPICMLLIGAGALGAVVSNSTIPAIVTEAIAASPLPSVLLAPLAGALMSSTAGSWVTGVILAAQSFGDSILAFGVSGVAAATMIQSGAGFVDVMPHGNIFLGSMKSCNLTVKERLAIFPVEAFIGLFLVISVTLVHGFILA